MFLPRKVFCAGHWNRIDRVDVELGFSPAVWTFLGQGVAGILRFFGMAR